MDTMMDLCFLCTKDYNCIFVDDRIASQVESLLPEITVIKLGIPLRICSLCDEIISAFSKLKQIYVENSRRLETVLKRNQTQESSFNPQHYIDNVQLHEPQSQEHGHLELNSRVHFHTPEEMSVMIKKLRRITQTQGCYNNVELEKCERIGTKDNTSYETNVTFVPKYNKIQETVIHEEHLEKQPALGKDGKNNQTENRTQGESTSDTSVVEVQRVLLQNDSYNSDETSTLLDKPSENKTQNESKTLDTTTTELQSDLYKFEEIFIKEEPLATPQDTEMYNKLLQNILTEGTTDNKPEHDAENDNTTCNTREDTWNDSSSDLEEIEINGNCSKNISCNETFTSESHLEIHSKTQEQKLLSCTVCNKLFKYKTNIDRHMKCHSEVKDLKCDFCSKCFMYKSQLDRHINIHNTEYGFKCHICGITFMEKNDLIIHMKTHSAVKDFHCNLCNESFSFKSSLSFHMKIHCDTNGLKCTICDKSFKKYSFLSAHMKLHCDIKDTQCHICKKQFPSRSKLERHVKSHLGVKDFHCNLCSKTFTQESSLKCHIKNHSVVKDFGCDLCEKAYANKVDFVRHLKSHSGIKDFKCDSCGKSYATKSVLVTHKKKYCVYAMKD